MARLELSTGFVPRELALLAAEARAKPDLAPSHVLEIFDAARREEFGDKLSEMKSELMALAQSPDHQKRTQAQKQLLDMDALLTDTVVYGRLPAAASRAEGAFYDRGLFFKPIRL